MISIDVYLIQLNRRLALLALETHEYLVDTSLLSIAVSASSASGRTFWSIPIFSKDIFSTQQIYQLSMRLEMMRYLDLYELWCKSRENEKMLYQTSWLAGNGARSINSDEKSR